MQSLKRSIAAILFLVYSSFPLYGREPRNSLEEILRIEEIKSYNVPVHEQSKEWLIKQFGPGDPYPLNLTLVTKNIVWQARENIRQGKEDHIQGIIRTFWYTHIKPVFARTGSLNEKVDQSDVLNRVLVDLVRTRDIMRYKDFGFLNNNAGTVKIGSNWHVMIVGEKHGKFAVLDKIAHELNCTVMSLGGQPSLLSMEYLVDDYKAKGIDIRKSMYLIFVVDYDPAGWIIRDAVITDIKFYGIKNIKVIDIVLPDILTMKELELAKFPLPESQKALNEQWLKESGGINGTLYGFESDSVPYARLKKKIIETATPYVGDPEIIRRGNAVKELHAALHRVVQIKVGLITE